MHVRLSESYPDTYFIVSLKDNNFLNAEFCTDGNIKIQIWVTHGEKDIVPREDLTLLYTQVSLNVWMPLFFNGRLL